MTDLSSFCEQLCDRLSVHESYRDSDLPESVKRLVKRLLRDYNFPKSVRRQVYTSLVAGQQTYTLPSDNKRLLAVFFSDITDPAAKLFSAPLLKHETFTRPQADAIPRYYWIEGNELWTDILLPAADASSTNLELVYQSNDPTYNLPWLLAEYEDVLFSHCMYRLAGELSKPELMQTWQQVWMEDQRSLAIYQNELEFGGLEILMREAMTAQKERYPTT